MIRHFFKLMIHRNFRKNKYLTLLNVLGLAVGFTAFMLIMLFVQHERSYDRFHADHKDIYRVMIERKGHRHSGTPARLAPFLKQQVPEVEDFVRLWVREDVVVRHGKQVFFEKNLLYADPSLFGVFDFRILRGDKSTPLASPHSLILTQSMARKYFGSTDPIGQTLMLFKSQKPFTVTAIASDPPANSNIAFGFIVPFELMARRSIWGMFNYDSYLKLDHRLEGQTLAKIRNLSIEARESQIPLDFVRLLPLKEMRFDPALAGEIPVTEKKYLYIYLSAAIFVLLLAAINYTNLASAISLKRSRELALRKIAGSNRLRIIMEVMMESVVFSLLALFVAVIFVELSRPYFIRVMDRSFVFDYSQLPLFLLIAVLVGLLAGIYPAIFSSRFRVMSLLKETANKGPRGGAFRNVFVMIQFGITSFLLICALTFTRQLHYIQAQDLGMETDQVYNLPVHWSGVKVGALKAALVQNPVIQRVSTSSFGAGLNNWHQTAYWPGPSGEESCQMDVHCVDPDFFETLGIHFLEGADTYRNQGRTDSSVFIISASARDHMGWDRAVGRQYGVFGPGSYGSVAGVVDDIRFRSLHQKGYPTAYVLVDAPLADKMQIKVREDQTGKALAFARQQWKEFAPATAPFMLTSLEEGFANLYEKEQRTRRIVGYFTGFALIISLFGLASMATYISMQRTKEVGVRKVIGANRQGLIRMLIGSFVKWVIIAFLLATPLAYLYLTRWLQNFAYHLDSSALAGVFVISGVFALAVGVSGVLFQAWRVSGTNPVHALRDE